MNTKFNQVNIKNALIFFVGLIFIVSFLVAYVYFVSYRDWLFDLSKKGSIGDAIGGITAPIVGIIGALLIYLSFRSQVQANRLLANQNNLNLIIQLITELKSDIQLAYDIKRWSVISYITSIEKGQKTVLSIARHFNYTLQSMLYINKRIISINLEKEDISILKSSLQNLYTNYLFDHCKRLSRVNISSSKSVNKKQTVNAAKELYKIYNNNDDEN